MTSPLTAPPLVGKLVADRWRVVQLLASGGIGHVYVAEPAAAPAGRADPRARVAVKVLRGELGGRPDLVARFRREATAAARVRHENVIRVLEPPALGGSEICFVTELLVGLDLADTLADVGALSPARAVRVAAGVAEGLAAAHAVGVVHRDLKPENIFLVHARDGSEAVKILDFGLAFLPDDDDPPEGRAPRRTGVGTPEYMAPEQARGAHAAPRADVYSLGVVMYEMITGKLPPRAGRRAAPAPRLGEVQPATRGSAPPPPPPSPALVSVIERALAPDPDARFPSMLELTFALLAVPEAR